MDVNPSGKQRRDTSIETRISITARVILSTRAVSAKYALFGRNQTRIAAIFSRHGGRHTRYERNPDIKHSITPMIKFLI